MITQKELALKLSECLKYDDGHGDDYFDLVSAYQLLTPIYQEIERLQKRNLVLGYEAEQGREDFLNPSDLYI
jgi:hypothetical protein